MTTQTKRGQRSIKCSTIPYLSISIRTTQKFSIDHPITWLATSSGTAHQGPLSDSLTAIKGREPPAGLLASSGFPALTSRLLLDSSLSITATTTSSLMLLAVWSLQLSRDATCYLSVRLFVVFFYDAVPPSFYTQSSVLPPDHPRG